MLVIDDYLDLAREKKGFKSDRELCRALGLAQNAVNYYRTKRSFPSDQTMLKLIEFCYPTAAGDELQERCLVGLLQLNQWRTDGPARRVYETMATKLAATLVAVPLVITLAFPSNVRATETEQRTISPSEITQEVYIMRQLYVWLPSSHKVPFFTSKLKSFALERLTHNQIIGA